MPRPLHSLALGLTITLVFGVPSYVVRTANETGVVGEYGSFSVPPTLTKRALPEFAPDRAPSLPANEQDDPFEDEDGTAGSRGEDGTAGSNRGISP